MYSRAERVAGKKRGRHAGRDGNIVVLVTVVLSSTCLQLRALYLLGPVHRQITFPLATDATSHLVGPRACSERAVHAGCGLSGNAVALLYPLETALFSPTGHATEVLRGENAQP